MNYFYGLIDKENNGYGFVDETDARVTEEMIAVSEEYHQQLLDEQATGLEIVSYNGRVFAAEAYRYYVDKNGKWIKRTEEQYKEIVQQNNKQLLLEKLKRQLEEIDNKKMRSVSAVALNIATEDDIAYLTNLEAQAEEIREQIRRI